MIKSGIKERVSLLISATNGKDTSIRKFCRSNDINYITLYNAFKKDVIGINIVHGLKKAVPELNVNWLLYEEGSPLCPKNDPL